MVRITKNDIGKQEANPFTDQVGGSHYSDMKIQPLEFCYANGLGFCEGLAIKYICRHGRKGNTDEEKRANGLQDLKKAIDCLQKLAFMEYGELIEEGSL